MSEALLKAKTHFANFRSPEMLKEIKVPEWEISIFYWPHLSMGERRAINLAAQGGFRIDDDEQRAIIDRYRRDEMEIKARARDQHGRLLFNQSDDFSSVDPGVVERIVGEMTDEYTTPETVEKN